MPYKYSFTCKRCHRHYTRRGIAIWHIPICKARFSKLKNKGAKKRLKLLDDPFNSSAHTISLTRTKPDRPESVKLITGNPKEIVDPNGAFIDKPNSTQPEGDITDHGWSGHDGKITLIDTEIDDWQTFDMTNPSTVWADSEGQYNHVPSDYKPIRQLCKWEVNASKYLPGIGKGAGADYCNVPAHYEDIAGKPFCKNHGDHLISRFRTKLKVLE